MYKVIISNSAQSDITHIYKYISEELNTPASAHQIMSSLDAKIKSLNVWPERCALIEGQSNRRIIHSGKYRIIYTVDKSQKIVYILHVLHALQNPPLSPNPT